MFGEPQRNKLERACFEGFQSLKKRRKIARIDDQNDGNFDDIFELELDESYGKNCTESPRKKLKIADRSPTLAEILESSNKGLKKNVFPSIMKAE